MNKKTKKRDYNQVLVARREIDLRTKSSSSTKDKYTRKQKYKKLYE
jgi:hypothetical protein